MPEIIVKFEEKIIERVVTEKKRITIGRTPENDIVLDNRGVSRKHAQLEFNEDSTLLIDNESLNGTFVNNRKITEEILKDNDIITIGKYNLIYHKQAKRDEEPSHMEGTMVLHTKKHKELVEKDRKEREIISRAGSSVILGEANTRISEYKLNRPVVTFGRADYVNVKVKGLFVSQIQAKIMDEGGNHFIINLGKKGKTKVNGEDIDRQLLKNDDIIQIGKSIFRYLEGKK